MPTNSARIGRRTRSRSGFKVSLRAMTASSLLIRADGVTKRFGKTLALDNVSLQVGRGEIFGLLGPNGAGKTTLIRTILDIIKPDAGRLEVFGRPFQPADRDRIGYLPEERGLYPRQPVGRRARVHGQRSRAWPAPTRGPRPRAGSSGSASLTRAAQKVEQLSKGNQQKVQVAATLLARPEIVILDEPLSGLDPVSARLVIGRHPRLRRRGTHRPAVDAPDGHGRVAVHARDDDRARTRGARRRAARDQAPVFEQRHPRPVDLRLPIVSARRAGRRPWRRPTASSTSTCGRRPAATTSSAGSSRPARSVEHFERLSTPLEEIFVRVATEHVPGNDHEQGAAHRAVGVPGHRHAAARTSSRSSRCRCCSASSARSRSSRPAPRRRRRPTCRSRWSTRRPSSISSWRRELAAERARARSGRAHRPSSVPTRPTGLSKYTELPAAPSRTCTPERLSRFTRSRRTTSPAAKIAVYGQAGGLFAQAFANQRQAQVADAIRASLLRTELSGDALARAYAPAARLERFSIDAAGQPAPDDAAGALGPFAGIVRRPDPADDVDLLLRRIPAAGHRRGSPEPGDGNPAVVGHRRTAPRRQAARTGRGRPAAGRALRGAGHRPGDDGAVVHRRAARRRWCSRWSTSRSATRCLRA